MLGCPTAPHARMPAQAMANALNMSYSRKCKQSRSKMAEPLGAAVAGVDNEWHTIVDEAWVRVVRKNEFDGPHPAKWQHRFC